MKRGHVALGALAVLALATVARSADERRVVRPVSTIYTDERDRWLISAWTDPETGCDYLLTNETLTPRLRPDGLPFCRQQ